MIKCTLKNFKISAFSKTLLEKLKARDCHKNLSVHISDKELYPGIYKEPLIIEYKKDKISIFKTVKYLNRYFTKKGI